MPVAKRDSYKCPECGKVYVYPQALGRHRLVAHGIAGTSGTALRKRKKGSTHAEETKAVPRRPSTLAKVTIEAVGQVAADGISDQILAVALGRFQQFCLGFAQEYDLPARMFTRRFASVIHAATIR